MFICHTDKELKGFLSDFCDFLEISPKGHLAGHPASTSSDFKHFKYQTKQKSLLNMFTNLVHVHVHTFWLAHGL